MRTRSLILFVGCNFLAGFSSAQPPANQNPSVLEYKTDPSTLYYSLTVEFDFGSKRYDRSHRSYLIYDIEPTGDGNVQVAKIRSATPKSPVRRTYGSQHPFYKIGPFQYFSGSVSRPSVVSPSGKLVKTSRPLWIMGLPVDTALLPFPELRETETWESIQTVAFIKHSRYVGYQQFVYVSSEIDDPFRLRSIQRDPNWESTKVVLENRVVRRVEAPDDKTAAFEERFTLDGSKFEPEVSYQGSGKYHFSQEKGSIDFWHREYLVAVNDKSQQVQAKVRINLDRLSQDEVDAHKQYEQERIDKAKLAAEQRMQKKKQLPEPIDYEAVSKFMKSATKETYGLFSESVYEKLDDLQPDAKLARLLYQRLPEFDEYRAKKAIAKLDGDLAKSVSILEKCMRSYGFEIAFTGKKIDAKTELSTGDLVCYPYSSSSDNWMMGRLHGEVDGVLVIKPYKKTSRSSPDFVAYARSSCRTKHDDLVDPKTGPAQ